MLPVPGCHNSYKPFLFYGALRKTAFYTNIHFLFITGGLLLNLLLAMVYQYINAGTPVLYWRDLPGFYTQGWPIMVQTFVILYLLYYTITYFNQRHSNNPNGFRRFLQEILFVLLVGFGIMAFFRWIFVTYMVVPEDDMVFLQRKLNMILTIDIAFLIVVYAFMTSFRIFRYLQQKNVEVAQWQREYTQSQFEAVKNQLNPHFLFNSLNALSSLVYVDANLAETFIEKLSRSYRYLLEQRDKQTVPLAQEMQFLDSFLFLTEQRFGKKLQVQMGRIQADGYTVPPHTLMIVMEQVLEHNTMSVAKPLQVAIATENEALLITHSHQPKQEREETNAQFNFLQEQFRYLGEREITITREASTTRLSIPLLTS